MGAGSALALTLHGAAFAQDHAPTDIPSATDIDDIIVTGSVAQNRAEIRARQRTSSSGAGQRMRTMGSGVSTPLHLSHRAPPRNGAMFRT